MSYESPIELLISDIRHQIIEQQDEQIYQAVMEIIPNINREELLKALAYDRDQYDRGYEDGRRDALKELLRCRECRFNVANKDDDPLDETDYSDVTCSYFMTDGMCGNDYWSRGERRTEDG